MILGWKISISKVEFREIMKEILERVHSITIYVLYERVATELVINHYYRVMHISAFPSKQIFHLIKIGSDFYHIRFHLILST